MAIDRKYTVKLRRKRKKKTNYKKRLKLLLSSKPRVVIRKSLKNIQIQLIEYEKTGDRVLVTTHSRELSKFGWNASRNNIPACYLTGLLFGKKALSKGHKEGILDIGLYTSVKGSKLYAALKGVIDAGFNTPHSKEIFQDESRIKGEHIMKYAETKKNPFQFIDKKKIDPKNIVAHFEEIKSKISGTKNG